MRDCRVCQQPVIPWRRGWRRPTTTIHAPCLLAKCQYCGVLFTVGRLPRQGKFCCEAHHQAHRQMQTDERLVYTPDLRRSAASRRI